ncbi:MAG: hypothetical protein MUF37_01770 [Methanoregulaceae archaeon]|jgi:hypothetical protein|nr:hypothetical protein [Methanoregulaceae archaeon]
MKKVTLALVLIAAFCLFAVSPVMAYTWTTTTDPYKASNVTAKYTFGTAGKNTVSFPTATYKPTIASTLDKTFAFPTYKPSITSTLDKTFAVSAMSTLTTSSGGKYVVVKAPWE